MAAKKRSFDCSGAVSEGGNVVGYSFGPLVVKNGVEFRLWGPLKDEVLLSVEGREAVLMNRDNDGWHRCRVGGVSPGQLYRFILPDGSKVPDPASRHVNV